MYSVLSDRQKVIEWGYGETGTMNPGLGTDSDSLLFSIMHSTDILLGIESRTFIFLLCHMEPEYDCN